MDQTAQNINQSPQSYCPQKPLILDIITKLKENKPKEPCIEIYHARRLAYKVLGLENKISNDNQDPNCGARWDEFFNSDSLSQIKPYQTEPSLLGMFCQSEPGYYNYLIGAVVAEIENAPNGMFLAEFPDSEFIVVTHEWVQSSSEADNQVGRIVGYAHGNESKIPDGYENYGDPIMFIESYNYNPDRYRFEVWLPIKLK